MMVVIFLLLLVCLILAWTKQAKLSKWLLIVTLVLAVAVFGHHVTDHLAIQL